MRVRVRAAIAGLVLATLGAMPACAGDVDAGGGADMAEVTVTSTAFSEGADIPERYTCHGAGDFPGIAWRGGFDGASALAVVVDDPDAPGGTFTHLVVLDLPPDATSLDAGARVSGGGTITLNSAGDPGWTPPCPPSGEHRYRFTVYGLSSPTGLGADATPEQADAAIQARRTTSGTLTGIVAA